MTPVEVLIAITVLFVLIAVGQYWWDRRAMRSWGERSYQHGYRDGLGEAWKGQPDPIGRHQGANDLTRLVSQPEDWTKEDLMKLSLPSVRGTDGSYLPPGEGKT